jgi:alpha-glucoside transport system permease protein
MAQTMGRAATETPVTETGAAVAGEAGTATGHATGATTADGTPPAGTGRRWLSRLVRLLSNGLVQMVLVVVTLLWLVPVFGLVAASFRPQSANLVSGWWTGLTKPWELTLANYQEVLGNDLMRSSLLNTVLIAVPSTVLVVGIAALAGYALAWIEFPASDWVVLAIAALLIMPFQIALIPVTNLYAWLGLFGTIPGVVLYHVAFGLPFAIFLLRNFYIGIPRDLLEAARMDGAREWRVFWKVVLPICSPALASLAVFEFLWVWNDFLVALVFADPDSMPITVALRQQLRQFGTSIDVLTAGAFLSMLVPLTVFFALQRYFVQGVLAGSTKQ